MMKKIFLISIFITFLIGSFCFAPLENNSLMGFAQRELEIEYPTIPGVETPTKTKTALPEYLRYVFTFALMIAGLLAFGALIYGGIRYLTSAGDPTKMKDGMEQVTAGILGLIILLSSYLILNTINPQLVLPEKPPIDPAKAGIRIYTMDTCQEDGEHPSFKITQNMKDLTDPDLNWGFDGKKIKSIEFLGKPGDLTVSLWSNIEFKGVETPVDYPTGGTEPCKSISPVTYKSISLDWHLPGAYLYASDGCVGDDYKIYQSGSATLPEFNDKIRSIKFVYDKEGEQKYAAILHEKENFMGKAMLYDQDPASVYNGLPPGCHPLSYNMYGGPTSISVSSITVYLKPVGEPIGDGVRFWGDKNYTKEKDDYVLPPEDKPPYGDNTKVSNLGDANNKISSMEMDGHYVALLFRYENYTAECEVFMSSCPDFRSHRIGQCGWLGRSDCLRSFIIKARK